MTTSQQAPNLPGFSTPLQMFGTSSAGVRDDVLWGGGVLLFGIVMLMVGFVVGQQPGPGQGVGQYVGLITFAVAFLFSLIWWIDLWWILGRQVYLFPEGVVEDLRGKIKACRWKEVEEIVYWSSISDLAIKKVNGEELGFGVLNVEGVNELAKSILKEVTSAMMSRLLERIRSGETVHFGRMDADKVGVTIHYRAHPSARSHSFYRGPWPRADHLSEMARAQPEAAKKIPWRDLAKLYETSDCDLMLRTSAGELPLCCWPCDVPNSVVLQAMIEVMRE